MKSKLTLAALLLLMLLLFFLLQSSARPQTSPGVRQQAESGEVGWDLEEFDPSLNVEHALSGMVALDAFVTLVVFMAALARRSRPLGWRSELITLHPS